MEDKSYKNKEWLYEQYIIQKRSIDDIGREFGISGKAIFNWLKKFDINKTERGVPEYMNKQWLHQEYLIKRRTCEDIGKDFNVHLGTIWEWVNKFELKLDHSDSLYRDKEWLHQEYIVKRRTSEDISKQFSINRKSIEYWINKFGLVRDKNKPKQKEYISIDCDECGTETTKSKSYYNRRIREGKNKFYCSQGCADKAHASRMNGENNPNHGGTWHGTNMADLSEEERKAIGRKVSDTMKKNGTSKGANNPRWAGGFKKLPCVICGNDCLVRPYVYRQIKSGDRQPCCSTSCSQSYAISQIKSERTSIEIKMAEELTKRGLSFVEQHILDNWFILDFLLPEHGIVIECDGDYWHNKPEVIKRDKIKNGYIKKSKYKLFRFWESEINENVSACVDKVIEEINKNEASA